MEIPKVAGGREITSVVIGEEQLAERIAALGNEIAEYYGSGELVLLGLLKGSFVFLADLVRKIPRPFQVDFLMAASYGSGTKSSGDVRLLYEPETELEGKHVLLIEDIVDSGNTLSRVIHLLEQRKPRSLEICTLLHKRMANALTREPRFVGFDAPAAFLVGYGLDHAEDFRHLPFIASIED
jgi:hypoxanthine phosphoribosyltransferase